MSYFTQLTQLLSEPPGTLVFHLVTLFALQAILGMALHQWRQDKRDRTARRMAIAAGVIFLAEGVLLVLGLLWRNSPTTAVAYLPPLVQTNHALTAVVITWALASHRQRFATISNALLIAVLITLLVMTISFTQEWQLQYTTLVYGETTQALIGSIFQLAILVLGFFVSLLHREGRLSLRPIILLTFVAAYGVQFAWGQPASIAVDSHAAFWLRLGYLIAFPLWAVHVYRRLAYGRLPTPTAVPAPNQATEWSSFMPHITDVVSSLLPQPTLLAAIELLEEVTHAKLIGLGIVDSQDPATIQITTNLPQAGHNTPRTWQLKLDDWPAFRLVREQGESVELSPTGIGARQLHLMYAELGLSSSLGAVLIHPLRAKNEWLGVLFLSHPQGGVRWQADQQAAIPPLASFIAQAINNSHLHTHTVQQPKVAFQVENPPETGRLLNLEEEHTRLRSELEMWQSRARQAEGRAAEARKQAQDLADTLQELERVNRDEKIQTLEAEIEALRESLMSAEEAMAMAAAGETDLSTEWVMLTITRYSSQLEEAQARIEMLENQLKVEEKPKTADLLEQTLQDLRTPMTSIVSYLELLMGEEAKNPLSTEQRAFVEQVKANAQRVEKRLKQVTEKPTAEEAKTELSRQVTDLEEVMETALHTVITQVRERRQRLELNIASDLPPLSIHQETLQQIMTRLLENATQAAGDEGHITISAQSKALAAPLHNNQEEILKFIHIAVRDSGPGISMSDRAYVFTAPPAGTNQTISGLGSSYQLLAEARNMAVTHGARMWVDGEPGNGSTFSVLFPITTTEVEATPKPGSNGSI